MRFEGVRSFVMGETGWLFGGPEVVVDRLLDLVQVDRVS